MPFLCWGVHHEDVSASVVAEVAARPIFVARAGGKTATDAALGAQDAWRVIVTCTEGHDIVFEGRGPITLEGTATMPDVIGGRPSTTDTALDKAAQTLAPTESLTRLDTTAKYFIGLVSLLSTFATAFGMWPVAGASPAAAAIVPTTFAALSVIAALFALMPITDEVRVNNLESVNAHFRNAIKTRARAVFASGVLLALALGAAPFAMRPKQEPLLSDPSVNLSAVRASAALTIAGQIAVKNAAPGSTIAAEVRGFADDTPHWDLGDVLAAASNQADAKGTAQLTLNAQVAEGSKYRFVKARILQPPGGRVVSLSLNYAEEPVK